jgi:hypothetical protein
MSLKQLTRSFVHSVLPKTPKVRKVPFGVGSGIRMWIDFRYNAALFFGIYENELNSHIRRLVTPNAKCFDVGGHIGFDALVFHKYSQGPVVSFECNAKNVETMRQNFAANNTTVQIISAYVGDGSGDTISLDTIAEQTFYPDFIKLDIERAEVMALQGATKILQQRKPNMIIEVHGMDKEIGCLEILKSHGYLPLIVDQRKRWYKESRGMMHNRWLVCEGNPA